MKRNSSFLTGLVGGLDVFYSIWSFSAKIQFIHTTHTHTHHTHIIYIYTCGIQYSFSDFFIQTFRIVVDFWKFTMLLLYISCDD